MGLNGARCANAAAPPGALLTAPLWMIPAVVLLGISQSMVYRVFASRVILAEGAEPHDRALVSGDDAIAGPASGREKGCRG